MQKCSAPITRAYSVPADYRAGEAWRGGKSKEEATVREWLRSARKDRAKPSPVFTDPRYATFKTNRLHFV